MLSLNTNFLCETKLKAENPALHRLFANSVFCVHRMLLKYQNVFPDFTDHTALHSMEVIDFCNALIAENIDKLNTDEIYILLMSAYLHDSGMGISAADYKSFSERIGFGSYFDTHSREDMRKTIRDFHHEFSGEFIKKYAPVFEIPSEEHVFCVVQASRGHRKVNLWDEKEYPAQYSVPGGSKICLPYLSALIRLADELDIAADRNLMFMYNIDDVDDDFGRMEFMKHKAIRHLSVTPDALIMDVDDSDEAVFRAVLKLREKMNDTLQACRDVVEKRTPFTITQKEILIRS